MAFETQAVNIKTKKILGVGEFAVSTKISLDLEKPPKKVLSIKAIADVTSIEAVDTDFTTLGKTQVNVLYLTENDTLENITGYAEWQNTTKAVGENLQARVNVQEVSCDSFSASEVNVSILHNIFVEGIIKQEFMPVSELSDDYVCNTKTVAIKHLNATANTKFVLTENIDMPNAQGILNVDAYSKIKSVYCAIDQVTIEGEVDLKILYVTAEGTATINKALDFKQEVACLGAVSDNSAYAYINVSSVNATLEMGEKTNLVLALGVNAVVDAYSLKEFNVVADLFSLTKEINTVVDCVNYTNYKASKFYADTIVSNVNLENYNVDEIVALLSPIVQVSQYKLSNNEILLEGIVNATLIYKNNEVEQTESILVACPFISKVDTDLTGVIDCVSINANINSVKIRSGKEIEVMLDLFVGAINNQEDYFEYVKNIDEVSEKQQLNSAITIYVTKENETLFNVAKALNVSPEVITNQNEVVDGKFASGSRIFVYSPLNAEF